MTASETTADLRGRVDRKFRKLSGALTIPEHVVLHEVPVDSVELHGDTVTAEARAANAEYAAGLTPTALARHEEAQARWATMPVKRRRIDVLAIGQWRKVAGHLVGFEVKATRSDLLTELRDPLKAEAGARYCHRWWLVLPDLTITAGLTLPDRWGILVRRGQGLAVARPAPTVEPLPPPPRLMASIVAATTCQAIANDARGLQAIRSDVRARWGLDP